MIFDVVKENECFLGELGSLRSASEDCTNSECMTESLFPVVQFDEFARKYADENHYQRFCSVDALLLGEITDAVVSDERNNVVALIEFKNGKLVSNGGKPNRDAERIKTKAYCSVLLLADVTGAKVEEMRKSLDFILVYEPLKNSASGVGGVAVSSMGSLDTLAGKLHDKACKNFVRFGLHALEGFCFRKVYTLTVDELEDDYMSKIQSVWKLF